METCPYWTEEDRMATRDARSFTEIGTIALCVLGRFPLESHGSITQVCGPISTGGFGSIQENLRVFKSAVRLLRVSSVHVFDQTPLEDAMARLGGGWRKDPVNQGKYCWPILEEIYHRLFASGSIGKLMFLPGAESSTGSRWEMEQGRKLGMAIEQYPEHLYKQVLEELGHLKV